MNLTTIVVTGVSARSMQHVSVPAGIQGGTVIFDFLDPQWEGLTKTAVFSGNVIRSAVLDGNMAVIPRETVAEAGDTLKVGIYGVDGKNNLVIPTLWATVGSIQEATVPSEDPGTDPELPIWAQLAAEVEELRKAGEVPVFDPAAYGLPVLALTGDTAGISKENAVTLIFRFGERTGSCTLKWQGSSSLAHPKKNYTVEFDQVFEAAEGWGAQKKYCLKADYIDFSHARNVVSAKLWGKLVKSRTGGTIQQIKTLPNGGAIDGFPCVVTINSKYMGIYNFNIPKDRWMMGMGSGTNEAILCAESYYFNKAALVDGTDLELEYVTDENDSSWVAVSLNRLVNAVLNSDGTDIDTTIAQYLDIDSAIDYLIFTVLQYGTDNTGKNYILATYDGVKWFFSAYDMDGTWGLRWSGDRFFSADLNPTLSAGSLKGFAQKHKLMGLLHTHKYDAIQKRYNELRRTVLSETSVEEAFLNYISAIPKALYDEEVRIWPGIPSTMVNNVAQIVNWYQNRCEGMDTDIGVYEDPGVTYMPEIAGFIRDNGTISTSANYKRTDYLPLDGVTEAEYVTFVVGTSEMATWALFDSDKKWLASSDDKRRTDFYVVNSNGNTVEYGLLHNTVSITELLHTYPNAKYIVMSTNNTAAYEVVKNFENQDVGWGSTEQYITLK